MRQVSFRLTILIGVALLVPLAAASSWSRQPMPTTLLAAWQGSDDYPYFVAQDAVLAPSGAPNDELLHPAAVTAISDYLEAHHVPTSAVDVYFVTLD